MWRYFGRTGGSGRILFVYRIAAENYNGTLDFEHFPMMQLLCPDGTWEPVEGERLEKDWVDGWFNESYEIDEAKVKQLIAKWNAERWPGYKWRYFGTTYRSGRIVAVYRIAAEYYTGKHFPLMQLLRPDGTWSPVEGGQLDRNRAGGLFDERNEMDVAQVAQLIAKWNAEGWPAHESKQ